ncbi:MAG: toxin TcdB middle/N-terminal domain-containing protein [Nitrospirota bacterium]
MELRSLIIWDSRLEQASASGRGGSDGIWSNFEAIPGDFNGDGKTDLYLHGRPGTNVGERMGLSTGNGFELWTWSWGAGWSDYELHTGDFNGDGKTDIYLHGRPGTGNHDYMGLSTGTGFNVTPWTWTSGGNWTDYEVILGDFNGDAKTDLYIHQRYPGAPYDYMGTSTGTGFQLWTWTSGGNWADYQVIPGDYNGDGKTDIYIHERYVGAPYDYMGLSTGTGFQLWTWSSGGNWGAFEVMTGDFNGDGKTDLYLHGGPGQSVGEHMGLSTGNGFNLWTWSWGAGWQDYELRTGDFSGDGKADIYIHGRSGTGLYDYMGLSSGTGIPYLLNSVSNGLAGSANIAYIPSTHYANTQLPFPVQTVSSITTNDGNGNVSTTSYTYSGGFYHIGERDFRGFHYAKVTGPVGLNGEQTITETWFHQGNDVAVGGNDPNVANGYMKGQPYRTTVKNGAGQVLTETTTLYYEDTLDGTAPAAPFYTPVKEVVSTIYNSGVAGKQTKVAYTYDLHGNVTQEDQHGDTSTTTDDRTIARTFGYNTTDWLVGFPTSETISAGIPAGTQMARTDFYYDGTTSCGTASTNQVPTKGHLTRVVRWLNGGTSPETRMAYDAYGNKLCTRDPRGVSFHAKLPPEFSSEIPPSLGTGRESRWRNEPSVQ